VDTANSPNVCFQDCVAPEVSVTKSLFHLPDTIQAKSSEDGYIYLVPVGINKDLPQIRVHCIDSAEAYADIAVNLPMSGCGSNGVYYVYARDLSGNVSDPRSIFIYFQDCVPPVVKVTEGVSGSGDLWYIQATSSKDAWIYLVPEGTPKDLFEIRTACIGDSVNVTEEDTVQIPLPDTLRNEIIYWLFAMDLTGNLSEPVAFTISGLGINHTRVNDIKIYPNPVNNHLTIETTDPEYKIIKIISLNGQLLYSTQIEEPTFQIDLSSFQKGVYFITVRSRDQVWTEKIIKF